MSVQSHQKLGMDSAQEAAFVRFFKAMPEKPASTVRFFDRKDYYTLHGTDAVLAAKEVFKSSGTVKQMSAGNSKLDYVCLNQNQFESLLRTLLLLKAYRVEIYTTPSSAKTASTWNLEFKASPGNLSEFEDVLFGDMGLAKSQPMSGVAAVKITSDGKNKVVGVGFVEPSSRQMQVVQFADSESFGGLECVLLQLAPRELLVPCGVDENDLNNIKALGERCGLLVSSGLKKNWFCAEDAFLQDMGRLLKKQPGHSDNVAALPQLKLSTATQALNACIAFLELVNESSNFEQFSLSEFCSEQFVRIDGQTSRAVNLRPGAGTSGLGRAHESLLGLLGQAVRTPQGQRLASRWLQQPLRDAARLSERQDCVEALSQDLAAMDSLSKDFLRGVPDLPALARKLHRKKTTLQDLYRIYQGVRRLSGVVGVLEGLSGSQQVLASVKALLLQPLKEKTTEMCKFVDMMEQTLDTQQAAHGEFLIRPEFDENLKEIHERRLELKEEMQKSLYEASRQLGLEPNKGVKLEQTAQWGFFLRITLKEEKVLRGNKNFQTIDTNKGGVRFVNDKLKSLNDDYQAASEEYLDTQKEIVTGVVDVASTYSETLMALGEVLAHVDVLNSFAVAATSSSGTCCRPKLLPAGSGLLRFKQLRHPCLERQPGVDFVPNDAFFDKESSRLVILTGPNMGGKSTYIRSVGAAVVLAQVGAWVPAEEAEVSLVDAVLARIGASDSHLRGVSTFMAEMLETAAMLRAATPTSLLLVDELGRGTSTYDGFGIAWAISEHIAREVQCFCLFATHFHELTALASQVPGVLNKHVLAKTSDGTLILLYRVRDGPCDQSFGVHVARMANFPAEVVKRAEEEQRQLELQHKWVPSEFLTENHHHRKEGEQLIEKFLQAVAQLQVDEPKAAAAHLDTLRSQLRAENNPYVSQVLESFAAL